MVDDPILLSKFVRSLRGISRPFLGEGSDRGVYVVKAAYGGNSSNLLFNEAAGSILYQALGLRTPVWKPLLITESFIQDIARSDPENFALMGLHTGFAFGSRYLGESGWQLLEILSGTTFVHIKNRRSLWRAWLVDICAAHADNRQLVFTRQLDRGLVGTFIDHGHMFGGPEWNQVPHFLACRYLDRRIYAHLSEVELEVLISDLVHVKIDTVISKLASMPDEWKTPSGTNAVLDCLDRLQDATHMQRVADEVIHAFEHCTTHGEFEPLAIDS